MGRMKRLHQELEDGLSEMQPLDFDNNMPSLTDDRDWWRDQDAEMVASELTDIEAQADIEDMRRNGYA